MLDVQHDDSEHERVATGQVERIGSTGRAVIEHGGERTEREVTTRDHADAFATAQNLLETAGLGRIEAVGHRVVHGGLHFREATLVDEGVIEAIREVCDLAPLHNRPALAIIEASRAAFGPSTPMVAAFDTAYFAGLPEVAARYAVPKDLSDRYGIRRFGFHGLAHGDMAQRFKALRPDIARPRLITLQLGGGCSATASIDGAPVDTSMGYTPLEGLVMGTRSGDIDPALPLRLQALTGKPADEIEALLNTDSGLKGLAGHSEMRDLLPEARAGSPDAALAVDVFCAGVRKYVGAYMAVMGGADGIVFGGGIGENMPEIRRRVCDDMGWCGVILDPEANESAVGKDGRISAADSKVDVRVMRVDEAGVIARETAAALRQTAGE